MHDQIEEIRRQQFIDSTSYTHTLIENNEGIKQFHDGLADVDLTTDGLVTSYDMLASYKLWNFQIMFTAGTPLVDLAASLDELVAAYENYACTLKKSDNIYSQAVFDIDESMDDYVDYLNLLSVIILLRRVDLLNRAANLLADTHVYQRDAVIEDLLSFFLPDRPSVEFIYWGKPYEILIDVIDADSPKEAAGHMETYVKKWYPSMKGRASFWGGHEKITPEYSPYRGYWAMCAAAFTYLYAIDDASYRNELVYPKDLIDYARALSRDTSAAPCQLLQLRIVAGNPCTRTGFWRTPAREDSRAVFREGDLMPEDADANDGITIWQWAEEQ